MKNILLFLSITFSTIAFGQTATITNSGNWNDPAIWQNQAMPQSNWDVVIQSGIEVTIPIGVHAEINNLTYNGHKLIIDSLSSLNCGQITHNGDSILIHENGGLFQLNCGVNTPGNINGGTYSITYNSSKYQYRNISSPIKNVDILNTFSVGFPCDQYAFDVSDQVYKLDYPVNTQITCSGTSFTLNQQHVIQDADGIFDIGRGYAVTNDFLSFSLNGDSINNGNIITPIYSIGQTLKAWNFVGNPYPSSIDGQKFIEENISKFSGSIILQNSNQVTKLINRLCAIPLNSLSNIPTTEIKLGQGFFIYTNDFLLGTNGTGTLNYDNCMRTNYHVNPPASTTSHVAWLKMENIQQDSFSTTAIGYVDGLTTDQFDPGFESNYINTTYGNNYKLTTFIGSQKLSIQSIAPLTIQERVIDLNMKVGSPDTLIFSIDSLYNFYNSISLIDLTLNDTTEITINNHQITVDPSDSLRFKLIIHPFLLGVVDQANTNQANYLSYFQSNNTLTVNTSLTELGNVHIYNVSGKLISKQSAFGQTTSQINTSNFAPGIYLVNVTNNNQKEIIKFVIQ